MHQSEASKSQPASLDNKLFTRYRLTYTRVTGLPASDHNTRSVTLNDLLSLTSDDLQSSVQFNYMFDVDWLVSQYPKSARSKPLLLIHGFQGHEKTSLYESASQYQHVSLAQARLEPYGTHHTKMMILQYSTGMMIVIHTANLVKNDWHQKTQALWVSPFLPVRTASGPDCEPNEMTGFQKDLIQYLEAYRLPALRTWIEMVKTHDFDSVKVQLVGSVPGRHVGGEMNKWGHLKLRSLLSTNKKKGDSNAGSKIFVAQFSSIGSLGVSADKWLTGEFLASLRASVSTGLQKLEGAASLKLVYPCVEDVRRSLEGYVGGASLPYHKSTANKQPWLTSFMHKWRSNSLGRTRANPHVKSYAGVSSSSDKSNVGVNWFLVTSANLSKAAWGAYEKNQSQIMIRSYELGVLFLPTNFNQSVFLPGPRDLPMPFDWPLVKYTEADEPWIMDARHDSLPDYQGVVWCPP